MFETSDMFEILEYIDMRGNDIRMFDVTKLQRIHNMRELFLHDNKLSRIDDFSIYYKKAITLAGTPWHCEMALSWMSEDDMAFDDRLVCETPDCLWGILIADMSKYNKRQHACASSSSTRKSAVATSRFNIIFTKHKAKQEVISIDNNTRDITS